MACPSLIVSLDGFSLSSYVIKEMTIIKLDGGFDHFLFAPPSPISQRSSYERRTIQYTTRRLSQIGWDDGDLSYSTLFQLLKQIPAGSEIICHGNMAREFLRKNLNPGVTIRDTAREGKKYPDDLPHDVSCGRVHNHRYCSLVKGLYILNNFL